PPLRYPRTTGHLDCEGPARQASRTQSALALSRGPAPELLPEYRSRAGWLGVGDEGVDHPGRVASLLPGRTVSPHQHRRGGDESALSGISMRANVGAGAFEDLPERGADGVRDV